MHLGWLRCVAVTVPLLLQCVVRPAHAAIMEINRQNWITWLHSNPARQALILLYEENSEKSNTALELVEKMAEDEEIEQLIPGLDLMKQKDGRLAADLGIDKVPALVLIRDGSTAYYYKNLQDPTEILMWLERASTKTITRRLTEDTFEHLTQASTGSTTGHWLVLFYQERCSDYFTVMESIAIQEKLRMNVALVNMDENPGLKKRFKITPCLQVIFFRGGKMYRYETQKYTLAAMTSFITDWFRNVQAIPVPAPPTAFDELTEGIAKYLKNQLEGENRTVTLVILIGLAVTVVMTSVFCCLTGGSDSKQKTE